MATRRNGTSPGSSGPAASRGFVLYVEGARDRDILHSWARRVSPALAREIVRTSYILGGRQPARALAHWHQQPASEAPRGVCVLDRDGDDERLPPAPTGLSFFTWSRRHIESYLLVPGAISRGLRVREGLVERVLRDEVGSLEDEAALRQVDAKRLLGRRGVLSRALGQPVEAGRLARAMRAEEFHVDVHRLLESIRGALELDEPRVVVRVRSTAEGPG